MNDSLRSLLQTVFNLADAEFSDALTAEDVSSWDSLGHMDLVASLEKEYAVSLSMQEIIELQSFADVIAVLRKKGVEIEG
ncbi:MAG: acyl carrier protein [Gammaproteobacteria bacterium]|nr:acyl carrier protein [Gammaproteobacteria bacterium]